MNIHNNSLPKVSGKRHTNQVNSRVCSISKERKSKVSGADADMGGIGGKKKY